MAEQTPAPGAPPVYVQAAGRTTDGLAIASLVLGTLGVLSAFFFFIPGLVLGVLAITFGLWSRSRIKRSAGALGGAGLAMAGWIVGLCAFVFACIAALIYLLLVVPAAAAVHG